MSGWKDWQQLEIVTEADLQNFIQDQVVQYYANAAARTAAVPLPTVGMVSYLGDINSFEIRTNLGWTPLKVIDNTSQNYIINGGFDVWERGTSFAPTPSGFHYLADRWKTFAYATSSFTASQQALTPNDVNAIGFGEGQFFLRANSTSTQMLLVQPVEDVRTLAGQTVTVSFWAKAASSLTLSNRIDQNFGSGGSSTVIGTGQTAALTTSWQRFSVQHTLASVSGKTIGTGSHLEFNFYSSTLSTNIDIWGVQLEAGSVATPFRRHAPSLQGELAACQRYYYLHASENSGNNYIAAGYFQTSSQMRFNISLPVTMRAKPTLEMPSITNGYRFSHSTNGADDFDDATISLSSQNAVMLVNSTDVSGTAGTGGAVFTELSGAKIAFSAEL
jgi:hypothetical protein